MNIYIKFNAATLSVYFKTFALKQGIVFVVLNKKRLRATNAFM